jgi:peptidyl-tRNA hydrolase, PTH1 family
VDPQHGNFQRTMFLIIGLGNPGSRYADTRHNVGYAVIDAFAQMHDLSLRRSIRANAIRGVGTVGDARVVCAKPTTYMNESGRAARALQRQEHPDMIVVVHDDLDLALGAIRISEKGSSGGHNGIASIIDALGTDEFLRVRVGIGPNTTNEGRRIPAEMFVLAKFTSFEQGKISASIAHTVEALTLLVRKDIDSARASLTTSP